MVDAVLDDVADRLRSALEPGIRVGCCELWAQFAAITAATGATSGNSTRRPGFIDPAFLLRVQCGFRDRIAAVIDNGIEIGVITVDRDRDLLVTATAP